MSVAGDHISSGLVVSGFDRKSQTGSIRSDAVHETVSGNRHARQDIPAQRRLSHAPVIRSLSARRSAGNLSLAQSLPESLAFLSSYGIAPGVLVQAAAQAVQWDVLPEQALLYSGAVSEQYYYSALARHLGLQFVQHPVQLREETCFPHSIAAGFAPLQASAVQASDGQASDEPVTGTDGLTWLFAPQGKRLQELLTLQRRRTLPRDRFAITTPDYLRQLVFEQEGGSIARFAANDLADNSPDMSARQPATYWQKAILLALALLFAIGLSAGGLVWIIISLLAGSILSCAIVVRLFATSGSCDVQSRADIIANRMQDHPVSDHDLPVYTVIVAMYREERVVESLVQALDKIDYPAAKLDIKLVVEADDTATQTALAALVLPARYQVIVMPDGKPRTKPRALNAALALARGSLTCVFDAEDNPETLQLREAAHVFAVSEDKIACLQGRLVIDNIRDSWLTRMFAIEYAALFDVFNPGLAWLRMPIPLGGTSNHFRTGVLRALHGWDAWNVTEDADLGLRLARFGYHVETLGSSTDEEAPAGLGMWMRQRRRWIKGWMQTALVHLRNPWQTMRGMGPLCAIIAFVHFVGALLGFLLGPVFALATGWHLVWGNLLRPVTILEIMASTCWCFVFVAGLAAAFWPMLLGMKRRNLLGYSGWVLTLPAYWLLQTCAAWWAVFDLMRDPFHWHKTDHGIARTSRRAHPGS